MHLQWEKPHQTLNFTLCFFRAQGVAEVSIMCISSCISAKTWLVLDVSMSTESLLCYLALVCVFKMTCNFAWLRYGEQYDRSWKQLHIFSCLHAKVWLEVYHVCWCTLKLQLQLQFSHQLCCFILASSGSRVCSPWYTDNFNGLLVVFWSRSAGFWMAQQLQTLLALSKQQNARIYMLMLCLQRGLGIAAVPWSQQVRPSNHPKITAFGQELAW